MIHLVHEGMAELIAGTLIAERRGCQRPAPLPPQAWRQRHPAEPAAAAERRMRGSLAAHGFARRAFRAHASLVERA